MKKILIGAISALLLTSTVSATNALEVDVVSGSPEGSNIWHVSTLLRDSLDNEGVGGNLVTAGSCFNLVSHMENTDKPTIFIHTSINLVSNGPLGCSIEPTEENWLIPFYKRAQTFCSARTEDFDNISDYIKSLDEIVLSVDSVYKEEKFTGLADIFDKNLRYVPLGNSSAALQALLAGDSNLLYTGYTTSIANSEELTCWGTTFDEEINGLPSLSQELPEWEYSSLSPVYYIYGHNVTGDTRDELYNVLLNILETETVFSEYIENSFMLSGKTFLDLPVDHFYEEYNLWTR